MMVVHDRAGRVERAGSEPGDRADVCVHVVPQHPGWSLDETIRWLGQGLELPDVDPESWWTVWWKPDPSACEICSG